jgi:hypothetical protein
MEAYWRMEVYSYPYAILDVGIDQTFLVSFTTSPLYTRDEYPLDATAKKYRCLNGAYVSSVTMVTSMVIPGFWLRSQNCEK